MTFETYDNITDAIHATPTCEDSCMISKRKDRGLPEIEDCPVLQDYDLVQITFDKTVVTKRYLAFLNKQADEIYKFRQSIWYKLYKWLN